jgi:hypothetical protein
MNHLRAPDWARLGLGAVLVARPRLPVRLAGSPGRGEEVAARVLGARYVLQAGAGAVVPGRWGRPLDAAVDLVHAATMLGLAAASPTHRRLATASAAAAMAFAAADLRVDAAARHERS